MAPLKTTSYFDGRPDARFYVACIDDVVVSVRENLPTYGVTDGEVWAAWRRGDQLFEKRFADLKDMRICLGQIIRGASWPLAWTQIPRAEYAVSCPVCEAKLGCPCTEEGEPMLARKGRARVIGAPYRPEPHDIEVKLSPLVHAGRITRHHQSLHGKHKGHA